MLVKYHKWEGVDTTIVEFYLTEEEHNKLTSKLEYIDYDILVARLMEGRKRKTKWFYKQLSSNSDRLKNETEEYKNLFCLACPERLKNLCNNGCGKRSPLPYLPKLRMAYCFP